MAQICLICSKSSQVGGGYQNRVRATKFQPTGLRRRYPNLQWARVPNGPRIKICTSCIKRGTHLQITWFEEAVKDAVGQPLGWYGLEQAGSRRPRRDRSCRRCLRRSLTCTLWAWPIST